MNIKAVVLIVFSVLFVSCSAQITSLSGKGRVHIISTGFDYADSKVSSLCGTVADATETAVCLKQIYTSKGIEVDSELLINTPDSGAVLEEIEKIEAEDEDLIVFYFSGHGATDCTGAFLVCNKTNESAYDIPEEYTRLYMDDVYKVLKRKKCRSVIILDCCYAGKMANNTASERNFIKAVCTVFEAVSQNKVSVIASCREDQTSLMGAVFTEEGNGENHSLFTIKLLEALGWKHSSLKTEEIQGETACGYVETYPGRMSVYNLYRKILLNWSSEVQIPEINRTEVPVMLIP